ncbi:MAG: hypothetical protein KGL16_02425 [Acidobacteriota bacterium]|nr:hypothetical protein [Acidobacteriota bacterium]
MVILLRIGLTPIAFVLAARAQSRFGDWIGGRLIGLPLTTGPFLLTVCLTSSRGTAAHAAAGVTSGQMAVVVFCSAYAWTARRLRPLPATVASLALALAAAVSLGAFAGTWSAASAVWVAIVVSLALWPWASDQTTVDGSRPQRDGHAGDGQADDGHADDGHADDDHADDGHAGGADAKPAAAPMLQRALIATCVVATMSTLVPVLGARAAGLLTSAPILLSIILPGTHRQSGAAGAATVARGTIVSMAATVAFSAVLASSLPQMPVLPALLLSAIVLCALIAASPLLDRVIAELRLRGPGPDRARVPVRP